MLRPGLLYFAYGCNMDPDFLGSVLDEELAPSWPACARGWRLDFNKGGEGGWGRAVVANLSEDPGCCVFGVVYRLPERALAALDAFEGVPEHYRRQSVWVEPLDRRARQAAVTYTAQSRWLVRAGRPEPEYLALVLQGGHRHGLPEAYMDWVQALAEGKVARCYPCAGRDR